MKKDSKVGNFFYSKWLYVLVIYFVLSLILYIEFLSPSKNLMGTDWLNGGYANWLFMRDYIRQHHEIALWNPYIFSGMPTIGAFFPEILTFRFISSFLLPMHVAHVLGFIFLLTIAALSTYLFVKDYLKDDAVAFLAGILYGFSGLLVSTSYAGHLGRLTSMALFPLYLFLLKRGIDTGKVWFFLLMGSVVGFSFLNGHIQMTYFGILFIIAFFIFYNITIGNNLKSKKFYIYALYSILGGIVAALIYSFYLLPVYENLPFTARGAERGYDYAVSWSMPPEEIFNLITPKFSGILDEYWGRSYFKLHTEYLGVLTIFMALLAIIGNFKKDSLVRFLSIYGIFTLFYSWGGYTPIFKVFYYVIPMVKKFRVPNLMFFIFNFISVFLASFAISKILNEQKESAKLRKKAIYLLVGLAGLLLIFVIFKNGWISFFGKMLSKSKEAGDVKSKLYLLEEVFSRFPLYYFISLIFMGIFVVLINFMTRAKEKAVYLFVGVAMLAYLDLYLVNRNFIADTGKTMEELYGEDEIIREIKKDSSLFRVFPLMYSRANDGTLMINGIESIGGYTSSPPKRYQEFVGAGQSVMFNPLYLIEHPQMLNLLDCKYIIAYNFPLIDTMRYDYNTRQIIKGWLQYLSNFTYIPSNSQFALYVNDKNLGRVYFSESYRVMKADSILETLKNWSTDSVLRYVLLETDPQIEISQKSNLPLQFEYRITRYEANRMDFEVRVNNSGFIVFSQNYHPAWKVYIDGQKKEPYLANYAFMAVHCPEGEHKISLRFESFYHRLGFILTGIGFALTILAIVGLVIKR